MNWKKKNITFMAVLMLIFVIGLAGCDMGSQSDKVDKISELNFEEPVLVDHLDLLFLQEHELTVVAEGRGTFALKDAILSNGETEFVIDGKKTLNVITDSASEHFFIVGEGQDHRIMLKPQIDNAEIERIEVLQNNNNFEGFFFQNGRHWDFYNLSELNQLGLIDRFAFVDQILTPNRDDFYLNLLNRYLRWVDYEFLSSIIENGEEDIFTGLGIEKFQDIIAGVWFDADGNNIEAPEATVKILESDRPNDFKDALLGDYDIIVLTQDISLQTTFRILPAHNVQEIRLDGNTISVNDGPLTVEASNILITDGIITGDEVIYDEEDYDEEDSNILVIDGDNVTLRNLVFDVTVHDWYQNQDEPATNLKIEDSWFMYQSIFVSNVEMEDSTVYNRLGIEHDGAKLTNVTFAENKHEDFGEEGTLGILYANSNVEMKDIHWVDNYTGMYVGKSLKYEEYSAAKPSLRDANIRSDKDGMVWWAINHYKAELRVDGVVDVYNRNEFGPGLTMVGSDVNLERDGGMIYGTATFQGADVHFGWHTGDFLADERNDAGYWYDGKYQGKFGTKEANVPEAVDYQAKYKNADRLTVHGFTFTADAYVFTPTNKLYWCEDNGFATLDNGISTLDAPVRFGDLEFRDLHLWGDFAVVDGRVVDFEKMFVNCGNYRHIYAVDTSTIRPLSAMRLPWEVEDMLDYTEPKDNFNDYDRKGTIRGGVIISDTKNANILIFGNDLKVEGVTLDRRLYNVLVKSAWLEEVDMFVGESNTEDWGGQLPRDITVVGDADAYFKNVMWSEETDVHVLDGARLSFAGDINNQGEIKFEELAFVRFIGDEDSPFTDNPNVTFAAGRDIRLGHEINIYYNSGGDGYVEVNFADFDGWTFNGWKVDAWLEADSAIGSTCYEILILDEEGDFVEQWKVDLSDIDRDYNNETDIRRGVWLTDLLNRQVNMDLNGYGLGDVDLQGRDDEFYSVRIRAANHKIFDLDVEIWGRNCCSTKLVPFMSGIGTLNLPAKDVCDTPEVY